MGCFGCDPNARAAFGYENQIFVICTKIFVPAKMRFNATETEFSAVNSPFWVAGMILHAKHYPRKAA